MIALSVIVHLRSSCRHIFTYFLNVSLSKHTLKRTSKINVTIIKVYISTFTGHVFFPQEVKEMKVRTSDKEFCCEVSR